MFGGMLMVYFASKYISSGLMSLIYGLAPIISGLLAQWLSDVQPFGRIKQVAISIALSGLAIVCMDSIALTENGLKGIALVLGSVFCFSLSGVLVKRVKVEMTALSTTVGALWMSLPLFFLAWWFADGTLPVEQWSNRSLLAIGYLGVFGSLLGFVAYFYVLQKLEASTVALVTMLTPVFAIVLGATLNGEPLTINLLLGSIFVLTGLGLFLFGHRIPLSSREKTVEA
jgi:drug/metabolite transporter (DMT)-like permease